MPHSSSVRVRETETNIPTYAPLPPDPNPMFLERRVYQGSSGRVYPLPCTERFSAQKTDRRWRALYLENEFLEVMILPELGGRIHAARDKTNGYDFIYRQHVIKPALIGLAGAWASGGIEFNWPQHHRPSTFLPVDVHIEEHEDGSKTVWLSEHDPLFRMKGMHGVCLHPGRSVIELKVRVYNRSSFVQTFLWWANVATHVHEGYQSFLPPDVTHVADHAKGTVSEYPLCRGKYYGVEYGERGRRGVPPEEQPARFIPPHCAGAASGRGGLPRYRPDDLSWYANIPVPTSYMCLGSRYDFFGGYDHFCRAGLVHVANHHISPGKKQWTWGNHGFGYAWDRNLTDEDGPYIELMAGVYTDNQPDFAFLHPGETKSWSQFWYPFREIGPVQQANADAALRLVVDNGVAEIGVASTSPLSGARIALQAGVRRLFSRRINVSPGQPFRTAVKLPRLRRATDLLLVVRRADGSEVVKYQGEHRESRPAPPPATEPPLPADIATNDELYITGLHLAQYRHPTRMAEPYWEEALRRDPDDIRCNTALGSVALRAADFDAAAAYFRRAIQRATRRNPNPYDGEPYYLLGLTLRYQADAAAACRRPGDVLLEEAYGAFYKATWNQPWQAAAFHALAEIDCRRKAWRQALEHLDRSLRLNSDNLAARDLRALVLRQLGRTAEAESQLRDTLALDPLDWWARYCTGSVLRCDSQTRLDLVHDCARAGLYDDAIAIARAARPETHAGTGPTLAYTLAWLFRLAGNEAAAKRARAAARRQGCSYCFPSRVEEAFILAAACEENPSDPRAPYYLGCFLYDRKRHRDAMAHWERARRLDSTSAIVWRNLSVGSFNVLGDNARARQYYDRAVRLAPDDARLFFERDLLWKRLSVPTAERLRELERRLDLVRCRDDLSVEFCDLLNHAGRHKDALAYLSSRRFQPWEGGEGLALSQHERTHAALGRQSLGAGDAAQARRHFEAALTPPLNLGEAKHMLANRSHIHYWLGVACDALGDVAAARTAWEVAARFKGDFQERSVRMYSEMTYYSALSLVRLGRGTEANALLRSLLAYARRLFRQEAKVSYFATSLPARFLFDRSQHVQETSALLMQAQALLGLGRQKEGLRLMRRVVRRDPSRAIARDLLAHPPVITPGNRVVRPPAASHAAAR